MANTVINTPELLNLDSTTGATVLAKGTVNERPPTQTFSVEYLAVAGGGGGGYQDGGGGGAGGFLTNTLSNINNGQSLALTIGEGGAGGTKTPAVVNSGDNTVITYGSTTITAIGGGGGSSDNNVVVAASGGSGGGGAGGSGTNTGGAGTTGQGNAGGNGASNNQGGGGGGAGAAGQNATSSGANGGIGLTTTIISTTNATTASVGEVSGSNLYFAGGGGGDNRTVFGSGGLGGGTNAAANPIDAAANTGGGGGSAYNGSPVRGGAGGSGVIILKYGSSVTLTKGSGLTEASGSPFTEGSYKVSVFTQGTGNVTLSTTPDTLDAIDGTLRFNTETNKTEYFDGTGWYEIVDEYASGFIGPATNYFDTKLYTGNGGTQSIGGYINGSASFNGSSSKIVNSSFSQPSGDLSVSLWIKFNTIPSGQIEFLDWLGSGTQGSVRLNTYGSNNLRFAYGSGASRYIGDDGYTISTGIWYHLVLVIDGSTAKPYFNNNALTTFSISGTQTGTGLFLGCNSDATRFSDCTIDQVRIYNVALSSADVAALNLETAATATTAAFPSGQTAIATYTMDTSANGLLNTQDLSTVNYPAGAGCLALYEMNGNSNDTSGTYNGTPTNITYEGGAFDQAAVFNGSSSNIQINAFSGFTNYNFTLSIWIKTTDAVGYITSFRDPMYITLGTGIYSAGTNGMGIYDGTNQYFINNTAMQGINDGNWHHIAMTHDGVNLKGYIDGSIIATVSTGTTTQHSGGANYNRIGVRADGNTSSAYNGLVDQLRIFNTALTQAQVTTLARGIATSYSGAATNVNFNGHLDFAPGLVWIKARTVSASHSLQDTINGEGQSKNLYSDNTGYLGQYGVYGFLSAFGTNGFSVNVGSGSHTNANNQDYVSWNWKAGGAAVTNNEGTIASQVSANKDSGFSIVKYTGNNTDGATVGTGLTEACNIVIVKDLTSANYWCVGGSTVGNGENLYLNDSGQKQTRDRVKSVQTNTFTLGSHFEVNSSNNFIAYCWHSVAGYSKIGSYTGNSSTTGPIVYTTDDGTPGGSNGFKPRFIMVKGVTANYSSHWMMMDSARDTDTVKDKRLLANLSNIETDDPNWKVEFLDNGFQPKSTFSGFNNSAGTYIYMAFA